MNNTAVFHGKWFMPDGGGMFTHRLSGTLRHYGNKPSTLELIHEPNSGSIRLNHFYDVILGEDALGVKYSLFAVSFVQTSNYTEFRFNVRFILIGKHVNSIKEPCFDCCWVKYSFLNRWALDSRIKVNAIGKTQTNISLTMGSRPAFLSVEIEDGLRLMLWGHLQDNISPYDISISQATNLNIDTRKKESLDTYWRTINEFSRFLSVALFAEQHPSEIIFANKGVPINYSFLFDCPSSHEPWVLPLIKYEALKEKMPSILKQWHLNYVQITPICNYLIRTFKDSDSFDAPDFLIVAQALDGFYKRIVNNSDGKDTKQYKHQIEKLLKTFKDIDVVRESNLDAEILTQTRHKYSHLIPDGDKKFCLAAEGDELYWLTQKCIVLLTCCILSMLKLTTEEINLCCNESPVSQIAHSILF